jgi:hypothetical protein
MSAKKMFGLGVAAFGIVWYSILNMRPPPAPKSPSRPLKAPVSIYSESPGSYGSSPAKREAFFALAPLSCASASSLTEALTPKTS